MQYQIAQLRFTDGSNGGAGGLAYVDTSSSSNVQHNLLDYDLAPGWNLYGDNDQIGRMQDDSGYLTAYFEVEAGTANVPNFGFTTDPSNGGDGSSIDFYEASNNGGELIFSMKVLSGLIPNFEVRFESSDGRVAVQGFSMNLDGLVPNSEWQEFRFSLGDFFNIDNSNLVRITIAPDTSVNEMVQYQIAQLRFTDGSNGGASFTGTVPVDTVDTINIYIDNVRNGWVLWDCCGGTTPVQVSSDGRGNVAEFSIPGNGETVQGFITRTVEGGADVPIDVSGIIDGAYLTFDLKVLVAGANGVTDWLLKVESANINEFVEVNLNTSLEAIDPTIGEWQTFTFPLSDFANSSLDFSNIEVLMIFPAWGTGTGAIYQVDNVKIFSSLTVN